MKRIHKLPRKTSAFALTSLLVFSTMGCGQSLFVSLKKVDPAAQACRELEKKNPDAAISILNSALQSSPDNPQYLSILATAYAQRAGVDPLHLALNMGESVSSNNLALATSAGSSADFTAMFSLLPAASESAIADIDLAVLILTQQIAPTERQPGDLFKAAIYMTASMVLHVKKLDALGDGTLSTADLASLTAEDAAAILSSLATAITLLGTSGSTEGGGEAASGQAASSLSTYFGQISSSPGSTDEEKLRNYLNSNSGST